MTACPDRLDRDVDAGGTAECVGGLFTVRSLLHSSTVADHCLHNRWCDTAVEDMVFVDRPEIVVAKLATRIVVGVGGSQRLGEHRIEVRHVKRRAGRRGEQFLATRDMISLCSHRFGARRRLLFAARSDRSSATRGSACTAGGYISAARLISAASGSRPAGAIT